MSLKLAEDVLRSYSNHSESTLELAADVVKLSARFARLYTAANDLLSALDSKRFPGRSGSEMIKPTAAEQVLRDVLKLG